MFLFINVVVGRAHLTSLHPHLDDLLLDHLPPLASVGIRCLHETAVQVHRNPWVERPACVQ